MAKVATPVASPPKGVYASGQTVTLTCSTGGSTIFYTTDGSTPTHTAGAPTGTTQIYATPLSISLGVTLKALGYLAADTDSNVLTALYSQGYTISGTLGAAGAGATIFVIGNIVSGVNANTNLQECAPVIADSSGNYTTPLLPVNDLVTVNYIVIPVLYGAEFSPFSQDVTITNANVTGVNWSAALSYYHLVQDYSDTMNRGGVTQDPIVGWTTYTGTDNTPMQIVADAFQASSTSASCGAYPIGYTPQTDCYLQIEIVTSNFNDSVNFNLRTGTDPTDSGYVIESGCTAGNTGNDEAVFQIIDGTTQGLLFTSLGFLVAQPSGIIMNVGDSWLFMVRGSNLYLFRSSSGVITPMGAASNSSTSSAGLSGVDITMFSPPNTNRTSYKNFIGGTVLAGQAGGGGNSSWLSVAANNILRGSRSH